jgi:hypothetical protein
MREHIVYLIKLIKSINYFIKDNFKNLFTISCHSNSTDISFEIKKTMKNLKSWETFNEGKTMKASKSKDSDVKVEQFRDTIENFLKGLKDVKVKTVGTDLEVNLEDVKIQVMFRKDFVGVKKSGEKSEEFKYDQLGKIKSEIKKHLK